MMTDRVADQTADRPPVTSDEGIAGNIRTLLRSYDPLKASRDTLDFAVMNGVVRFSGYVNNKRSYRVLMDNVPDIPGVVAVDDTHLYDDETLTYEIGEVLPLGLRVRAEGGEVFLMGRVPSDVDVQELILDIAEVPGVARVSDRTRK